MWEQVQQALNESAIRVMTQIASLLPGVVALVVALLLSAILAWVLSYLLRRSLRGVNFDARIMRWGLSSLAELSPQNSPTLLVARTLYWTVMIVGFLIGVAAFHATLTSQLVAHMFGYLPNVLAAAVILVVGNVLAHFLARSVLIGAVNMNLQYARLLSLGVKWAVMVLTAAMVLDHLGIGRRIVYLAFGIFFGGIVLALALAVGLGSKDMVSRSLERQSSKPNDEGDETFRHL